MNEKIRTIVLSVITVFSIQLFAQEVNVDVNPNIEHSVDGVSDFGRERHMTIHSSPTDQEWNGHDDMLDYLINDLDVYFGRDNGSAVWKNRMVTEDPEKPHWPDADAMIGLGQNMKNWYERDEFKRIHQYERRGGMIQGMTHYPIYPTMSWDEIGTASGGWQPYDVDASAYWIAHYLDKYFAKTPDDLGEPLPIYWEGINEPDMTMYGAAGMFLTSPEKLWEFHNLLAVEIRNLLGDKAPLIGGLTWGQHEFYSKDWTWRQDPDYYIGVCESNPDCSEETLAAYRNMTDSDVWGHRGEDWFQWDGMWQGFIDAAGENMDFYGVHIYDWPEPNADGSLSDKNIRAGGHVEAMLDLMEWYDKYKFGETKDIVMSEFGSVSGYCRDLPYKRRDWEQLRPFNQMMMQFLERPSHIVLTMPFAPAKAAWGDVWNDNGSLKERYISTLMDPVGDYTAPGIEHEEWEWSGNILFYELWSDVDGTRIDTKSSDNDIQVDAYVDENHVFLILNNLETTETTIKLNWFDDYENPIINVKTKHLYLNEALGTQGLPVIDEANLGSDPGTVTLGKSATMILDYTFENPVTIDQTSEEVKYPSIPLTGELNMIGSTKCHVARSSRQELATEVNNVVVPAIGEAMIRIGGVYFDEFPESVTINGHELITGELDLRGRVREQGVWYGVWEVPCPVEYLETNNTVTCRADNNNNEYSTVMIQVWDFSKEPARTENNDSIAVSGISLGSPVSIMQNTSEALAVTFQPVNASDKTIQWSSSNPSVATVDEHGVVTAVASSGTATITAKSEDNARATASQTITAIPYTATAVAGISISEGTELTVDYYTNTPLTAAVSPADATIQNITWSSSNPEVVYVNEITGKVTGKVINESAIITATLIDTEFGNSVHTQDINITVSIAGPERAFNRELPDELRPYPNFTVNVPVRVMGQRDVSVELGKDGVIYGQGTTNFEYYGDTTIAVEYTLLNQPSLGDGYTLKVRLFDGANKIDSCSKEVEMLDHYRADTVIITEGIQAVQIGSKIQLDAEVLPENTYDKGISWSSSDISIADVDALTGLVTGIGEGIAIITATSNDGGHTDTVHVTSQIDVVVIPVDSIVIPSEIRLYTGLNQHLTPVLHPSWTTQTGIVWTSGNPAIAEVDANGMVTAANVEGTVIITATSADNDQVTATCEVTVSKTLIIEAEDFILTGGPFDGFQTYTIDSLNTGAINWNQLGDWADYEVYFPESGEYTVTYYIGAPDKNTDIGVSIYVDGTLQSTTALTATGNWNNFQPFIAESNITLSRGNHTIRIESAGTSEWQWNGERFELTNLGSRDVTHVELSADSITVGINQQRQLTETVYPVNATNKEVAWSSSNNAIATVDNNGEITGVAIGRAVISVITNDGGYIDTCVVTIQTDPVEVPVESVTVSPESTELSINATLQLSEMVLPVDADDKTVSWSSSNTAIATVNALGLVTGIAEGEVTITVTSNKNETISASCEVTVVDNVPGSLALDDKNKYLTTDYVVGETLEVTAYFEAGTGNTVTNKYGGIQYYLREMTSAWAVVNDVIVYDADAIGAQTGISTVSIPLDGLTPSANLPEGNFYFLWPRFNSSNGVDYVVDGTNPINIIAAPDVPVEGVSVDVETGSVVVGETISITETIEPGNATDKSVTWSSSNNSIATVDTNGNVTGISKGNIVITVTTNDGGFSATSSLTVVLNAIEVTGVAIYPASVNMGIGSTSTLSATITPDNATNKVVSWSSNNQSVATVDSTGKVTAVAVGKAIISVTTDDGGFTSNSTVNVIQDFISVDGVTLSPASVTIGEGATINLAEEVSPSNASDKNVSWSSGDKTIATVSSSGEVTGVSEGVVNITVITNDGSFTAISEITVEKSNSIYETNLSNLTLYPNPTTNKINIYGLTEGEYEFSIYNIQGEKVLCQEQYVHNSHNIVLENLPVGNYILSVQNELISTVFRFTIIDK